MKLGFNYRIYKSIGVNFSFHIGTSDYLMNLSYSYYRFYYGLSIAINYYLVKNKT